MRYQSTRSEAFGGYTSAKAILQGLAPDGGLFVPDFFPKLSFGEIKDMVDATYQQRAMNILGRFLTDFTGEELQYCVNSAYNKEKFETECITPVYRLNNKVYFLELWHGCTCAFKDIALQILPHLLTHSIRKVGDTRTVVILVATSGDTGKAALEGFRDVEGTKIAVFYPQNGVSDIQRLQMVTQEGNNVAVSAVVGNFDDVQTAAKRIFTDEAYGKELDGKGFMLSSANSINWGRLVPQIVYYFSAYCDLLKGEEIAEGEYVNFVVPTGNFGDILAGYYAKLMGLPVKKLICASNSNNVLTDFIRTGAYDRNRAFYTTESPSMDILISSNLERFLYEVSGRDCALVKDWMQQLSAGGRYEVGEELRLAISDVLWGGFCSDEDSALSIRDTFEAYGYIMDTHTAVGKNVYDQYLFETGDATKTIILSTASPFKFGRAVSDSLGMEVPERADAFERLRLLSEKTGLKIPQSLGALRVKEERFTGVLEKDGIKEYLNKELGI